MNDTIAAIATAMSDAGIGIIRVSGPQAVQIVDNCYLNVGKKHDLLFHAPNTIQYGYICNQKEEILDKEIEDLIAERQEARKAKNFARADEIRDELLAKGIILKDTREGVKWKRA